MGQHKNIKKLLASYIPSAKPKELYVPLKTEGELKNITYINKETEIYYINKNMAKDISQFTKPGAPVVSMNGFAGGDFGLVESWQ